MSERQLHIKSELEEDPGCECKRSRAAVDYPIGEKHVHGCEGGKNQDDDIFSSHKAYRKVHPDQADIESSGCSR